MKENCIAYRPYRTQSLLFVPFVMSLDIFGFIALVLSISEKLFMESVIFITYFIVCTLTFNLIYKRKLLMFIFNDNGVNLLYNKNKSLIFCSWDKLQYGYTLTNNKGFVYYVLSEKEIEIDYLRKIINRGKSIIDPNIFLIPIDHFQETNKIKELFSNKITIKEIRR